MHINHLTLMAVLLTGIGILLLRNESSRKKTVNWLYLFSGGLAIYTVETANHAQPFQNTLLIVLVLCLIPITIDGIVSANKNIDTEQ
jgi:hypothetical protein